MIGWNETPLEAAERVKKWRAGVGDWMRDYEWTHVVHLTTGERLESGTRGERMAAGCATEGVSTVRVTVKSGMRTVRRLRMVRGVWRVAAPAMPWERLRRAFVEEFYRYCTKAAHGPVCYAYAIEGGILRDRPHLHALLYGTSSLDCARMEEAWRHGLARVSLYDPQRGAAYYLAKEIGGRVLDYGWSSRLPSLLVDAARPTAA